MTGGCAENGDFERHEGIRRRAPQMLTTTACKQTNATRDNKYLNYTMDRTVHRLNYGYSNKRNRDMVGRSGGSGRDRSNSGGCSTGATLIQTLLADASKHSREQDEADVQSNESEGNLCGTVRKNRGMRDSGHHPLDTSVPPHRSMPTFGTSRAERPCHARSAGRSPRYADVERCLPRLIITVPTGVTSWEEMSLRQWRTARLLGRASQAWDGWEVRHFPRCVASPSNYVLHATWSDEATKDAAKARIVTVSGTCKPEWLTGANTYSSNGLCYSFATSWIDNKRISTPIAVGSVPWVNTDEQWRGKSTALGESGKTADCKLHQRKRARLRPNGIREFSTSRESLPSGPPVGLEEAGWGRKDVVNIPNILSFGRLVSGPFIAMLIVNRFPLTSVVALSLAGISDWADGFYAKRMSSSSVLGSYLDPLADKVLVACVALALVYGDMLPGSLVAFIVGRDVVLVAGAFLHRAHSLGWQWNEWKHYFQVSSGGATLVQPLFISKLNTALQLTLALGAILNQSPSVSFPQWVLPSLGASVAATTVLSFWAYVHQYSHLLGAR
eukprot:jgi/Mesvir1/27273/Mv07108-RA.1